MDASDWNLFFVIVLCLLLIGMIWFYAYKCEKLRVINIGLRLDVTNLAQALDRTVSESDHYIDLSAVGRHRRDGQPNMAYVLLRYCPICGKELEFDNIPFPDLKTCEIHPTVWYAAFNTHGDSVMVFDPTRQRKG